jgi:hypothetical protein
MTKKAKTRYRALVGMNYPTDPALDERLRNRKGGGMTDEEAAQLKRVEPGDIVDDVPEKSVGWLLKQGAIEVYKGERKHVDHEGLEGEDSGLSTLDGDEPRMGSDVADEGEGGGTDVGGAGGVENAVEAADVEAQPAASASSGSTSTELSTNGEKEEGEPFDTPTATQDERAEEERGK